MPEVNLHPLSEFSVVQLDDGQQVETMNTWAFASLIWTARKEGNSNAKKMVRSLLGAASKRIMVRLMMRAMLGDEAANREAINLLANALDEEMERQFKKE